jgi:DeoR/GlpR family transcriptional regulator of sugar metabolism
LTRAQNAVNLRDHGLLERVYGGALPVQSTEGSFAARSTKHQDRKQAIARLAATLVKPDDTIVIDVGTTALEVARALPTDFRGRVLTNSVPVAMELPGNEKIELLLSGGQVRNGDAACFGRRADDFFEESTRTRRSSARAACTPRPASPTTTRTRWRPGA